VNAWVRDIGGEAIPHARVDVWHADAAGGYDVQDPSWAPEEARLRAVFKTDAAGRFHFRTILPSAYPIPTDGPVGRMLAVTNRTAMRPAHIHFLVRASGYDTLITHVFVEGDPWLDRDAVFGVRGSCIAPYVRHEAGDMAPDGSRSAELFYTLDYTFRLQHL
jgi:hydroxyquinol 1,2-dioxygenase